VVIEVAAEAVAAVRGGVETTVVLAAVAAETIPGRIAAETVVWAGIAGAVESVAVLPHQARTVAHRISLHKIARITCAAVKGRDTGSTGKRAGGTDSHLALEVSRDGIAPEGG
jgi:hypothetical protein